MFPEYHQLIATLRQTDNHFASLYDKHEALDREIEKITNSDIASFNTPELSQLKVEKLELKEQIFQLLQKAEKEGKGKKIHE